MLFRNPRAVPVLMICLGLGLALYRGWELQQLPAATEAEIEQAVELNYMLDLARSRARATDPIPVLPPDEAAERKRAIRAEIRATEQEFRGRLQREFEQGLLMALCGGILFAVVLWFERRAPGAA